jgi:hypothetical protein
VLTELDGNVNTWTDLGDFVKRSKKIINVVRSKWNGKIVIPQQYGGKMNKDQSGILAN